MTPFTYGEITFEPVAEVLLYLKEQDLLPKFDDARKLVFYDLGSGFGKPCLAAALSLPSIFSTCYGIEYLEGLYAKSLELKADYDSYKLEQTSHHTAEIQYLKDDFLANTSWVTKADIIFVNATCFEDHMVASISKTLVESLTPGSLVIITTKVLQYREGVDFKRIGPFKKEMSWGSATVNIYIKL